MNAPHELNGAVLPPDFLEELTRRLVAVLTETGIARPSNEFNLIPDRNGDIGALYADLAIAQGAFEPIEQNKTAVIKNKEGKLMYTFKYADMGEIRAKTTPALAANGLGVVSIPTMRARDGGHILRTMLVHKSGARIESILTIPDMRSDGQRDKESSVKDFGGYITYLRRYQVSALLNVAADTDLDGSHEGDDEYGSDAPRIGAPSVTQAPFNPAEHPELAKATTLQQLNKAWVAIKEDKRPKFQAQYDARLEELTPPETGEGPF